MKESNTRIKIFVTCIVFMCVFMVIFAIALQVVSDTAFIESYSQPKIKELQETYDTYIEAKEHFEESVDLLVSIQYMQNQIINTLNDINDVDSMGGELLADELANEFAEYISYMDIYLIDKENIVHMYTEGENIESYIKVDYKGEDIEFIRQDMIFDFLILNDVYEEKDNYYSSHMIIKNIGETQDIHVIAVPRYDNLFSFSDNEMVICNKNEESLLRLNTENIKKTVSSSRIIRGKNYQTYGMPCKRYVVCYYNSGDERGDYCLGVIRDFDFNYRWITYSFMIVFFAFVGYLFWLWSDKVTKPLDFFLRWIKLVKEKEAIDTEMKMPKENYFLQNNIMMFFSLCLVPIIFAGGIQWYTENQILNKYIEQRYLESAEYYGYILDEKFNLLQSPVNMLCSDERIKQSLEDFEYSDDASDEFDDYIHEYLNVAADSTKDLSIYDIEGNVIVSSTNFNDADRYIKYRINIDSDYKWSFADGLDRFILHQKIYDDDGNILGYCKMELSNPNLHANTSFNKDYLYSCYIYKYTDKIYNLISSPNLSDDKVIDIIRSKEDYPLTKSILLECAGVNYFYIVKEKIFFDKIWDKYVVAFMNIVFFLSIALIFAASIITRATLNPIIHLSNVLYKDSPQVPMSTLLLGKEEFSLIVNRVKALSEQVDVYAKEQKRLEAQRIEHEKRRKDAEILTLQTQINPHFMYNIFSSISVLIRTGQNDKATKMVTYTGNLMRLGLYRGHVMIPLKEELDHVLQYINIQQIRYNNCMDVNINIEEKYMQHKVVKFILQPVVENAIEHNVGYLEDKNLIIEIGVSVNDDKLVIIISDNGRGMDEADINKLQNSINNFDMSNHLGLANINERIKLNCGEEHGVVLNKNEEDGLKVELNLPVMITKEE